MISNNAIGYLSRQFQKGLIFKSFEVQFKNITDVELKVPVKIFKDDPYRSVDQIINYFLKTETDELKILNLLGFNNEHEFQEFKLDIEKRLKYGT